MDLGFTLGVDADPVRHCRHGSEGPARPAASLVSDLLQSGTVRPFGPGVETGGDVLEVSHQLSLGQTMVEEVGVRVDSASNSTEVVVAGSRGETGNNQRYLVFLLRDFRLTSSQQSRWSLPG